MEYYIAKPMIYKFIYRVQSVLAVFQKLLVETIWILSEVEAIFSKPNSLLLLRRLYLRLNNVEYARSLWVGRGLRLLHQGNLVLGERCALGDFVRIANHAPIKIGDDFTGATGLHLDSGTHDFETFEPRSQPILIGNRVWCGINVTILAGVSIGDDVVLGAGSIVCKDIPSNSVAVGVPAKVIKKLNRSSGQKFWTWAKN